MWSIADDVDRQIFELDLLGQDFSHRVCGEHASARAGWRVGGMYNHGYHGIMRVWTQSTLDIIISYQVEEWKIDSEVDVEVKAEVKTEVKEEQTD